MDVPFLTVAIFGYVFSIFQVIALAFVGDDDVDKLLLSFPPDSILFTVSLCLKILAEFFILTFLATHVDVDDNKNAVENVYPIIRWLSLTVFLLGSNMWLLTSLFWLKGKLPVLLPWISLILIAAGSFLLTITVLIQTVIPSFMTGCACSLVIYSIIILILSIGTTSWYFVVDIWHWGGSFLKESTRTQHVKLQAKNKNQAIERELNGQRVYIESVPILDDIEVASI